MTIEEQIQKLATTQANLEILQQKLSKNNKLMKEEIAQTFIFELRDYIDSLSIVTDFTEKKADREMEVKEIGDVLGEQNQLLQLLISELQKLIEEEGSFFDQKEGALRRVFSNLQGILEVNGLMLQDNLSFRRIFKEQSTDLTLEKEGASEKKSFLDRLFGR
ncbi:hypothetical protein [Enterococcus olivae]